MKIPEQAFSELRAVYEQLAREMEPYRRHCDSRGVCCNFAEVGHMLYVTGLEAAEMARSGVVADRAAQKAGSCPFLRGTLCGIREQRAVGCRLYYCDPTHREQRNEICERSLRQVREIEARHQIEHSYGPVTEIDFSEYAEYAAYGVARLAQAGRDAGPTAAAGPAIAVSVARSASGAPAVP